MSEADLAFPKGAIYFMVLKKGALNFVIKILIFRFDFLVKGVRPSTVGIVLIHTLPCPFNSYHYYILFDQFNVLNNTRIYNDYMPMSCLFICIFC